MELYFIRHAQSANNALYENTGSDLGRSDDPELTKLGCRQAEYLAIQIRDGNRGGGTAEKPVGFGLTHLYTSLMVRAVATGAAIAQQTGVPMQGMDCLHECGGIYLDDVVTGQPVGQPGKTREYFQEHFPEMVLPETLDGRGWWGKRPYEGEDLRFPRAQQLLKDIIDLHGDTQDRVALISHGGFYNEFLAAIFGGPRKRGLWFMINNTGITRVDYHHGRFDLVYQNRTDHLPSELLT